MPSDYAAIRADNDAGYGTKVTQYGPTLLSGLYDDRSHFIFELLQNAEDALARRTDWNGSRAVRFNLMPSVLHFSHFGIPFTGSDVRGICGIAESTKDRTSIGRFGIGFKSVYAYTTRPEVHSGDEHFAIESYVRPIAVPSRWTRWGRPRLLAATRPGRSRTHDECAPDGKSSPQACTAKPPGRR